METVVEIQVLTDLHNLIDKFGNKCNKDFNIEIAYVLIDKLNEWIIPDIIQLLLKFMEITCKTNEKKYSLLLLKKIIKDYPEIVKYCLIYIIPFVINLYRDTKNIIRTMSNDVLSELLYCDENKHLEKLLLHTNKK